MFLTADDMHDLTGYQYHQKQIDWLKNHGWRYELSRTGRPIVHKKHAEEMLTASMIIHRPPKLNLAAIKKAA